MIRINLLILYLFYLITSHTALGYSTTQGCDYKGKLYDSGSWVETSEPCLQCRCIRGTVVCRLKSCHPVPDPPPQGCVRFQKSNQCCPLLHCKSYVSDKNDILDRRSRFEAKINGKTRHHGDGCLLNGTMYGEGSALVTSSRCEYCYCIKGRQQCIRPQCLLSIPGCTPVYSPHSCCPIKYNCSTISNLTTTSSTTALPESTSIKYSEEGCEVDGVYFPEGEKVEEFAAKCENCFCVKGTVRCDPVTCGQALDPACTPVHFNGQCCPSRFNCSGLNELDKTNIILSDDDYTEVPTTIWPTITSTGRPQDEATTHPWDDKTEEFPPTFSPIEVPSDSAVEETEDEYTDTEQRNGPQESNGEEGTTSTEVKIDETTTLLPPIPARTLPPELEAILNRTLQRHDDSDYDYEYNESSLPPSLPNLKIIPFVAADAVVDMDGHLQYFDVPKEALGRTESSNYYSSLRGPLPSRFSPPVETEGGFMPRDPVLDGPYYETKHIKKDSADIDITTSVPPQATPQVLERCIKGGRVYQHGEIVSELNACELCMCYFGYIHCQEPKCAPVVAGCFRVKDVPGSCCGRIQCGPNVTENSLQSSREHSTTLSPIDMEMMTNIPIITVADDIVTPDILKELAIRTEIAPDLTNMANFLTYPPPIHNVTDLPKILNATTTSTIPSSHTKDKINETLSVNKTNKFESNLGTSTESSYDDYGDFSFGSVLDMLFGNGADGNSAKNESKKVETTLPPRINTTVVNNTLTKIDPSTTKVNEEVMRNPEKIELPTKAPVYSYDYDADIIRNTHEFSDQISVSSDNRESNISVSSVNPPKNSSHESNMKTNTPAVISKADPVAAFGLLKLDGCNIYGKMYRIGKVITELSGPCLECRCTQVGVQCEPLNC